MSRASVLLTAALTALALGAGFPPPAAVAEPPPNDAYLESTRLDDGRLSRSTVTEQVDTREATVQADLFAPGSSGGGPEPARCQGVPFGRTVWYDLRADTWGTVEIQTSGFDAVVAVHRYGGPTSPAITGLVGCANEPGNAEDVFFPVERGRFYTVQIGGVDAGAGPAGGLLQASFDFFPDKDRDEIPDALDKCSERPGIRAFGGCLPRLRGTPKYTFATTDAGLRFTSLRFERVSAGSRIEARCVRGCSIATQRVVARRAGTVAVRAFVGRELAPGTVIDTRVTHPRTRTGHFRFGAIGVHTRLVVGRGDVSKTERCLLPDSRRPRRACR